MVWVEPPAGLSNRWGLCHALEMAEHGWFSDEQAKRVGAVLFRTPEGGIAECSLVTRTLEEGLTSGFADIVYRGEVDSFLRRLRPGRGHGDWKYQEEEQGVAQR